MAPPTPAAPTDDMSSKIAQLKSLGGLKEQGVLTDAELQSQTAAILGA